MRPGQQNNNKGGMRNRNRNRKGPNPLTRSYESNGGDVKIRGTALHVAEKYVQLARDAQASGDRVASENYLQHAEHYYRIVAAAQAQMPQQPGFRSDDGEESDEDGEFNNFVNSNFSGGNPNQQGRPQQQGGGNWQGGNNRQPYQGGGNQQPQGGQAYGGGNEMPAFIGGGSNGNGGDLPQAVEGAPQGEFRGDDNRGGNGGQPNGGQNGQNFGSQDQQRERGNFRHRRRRPFREPYQGERGGNGEPREQAPASGPADASGFDAQDGE